ncbi:hypothetical protein HDK90DRAFT_527066 [Phyllosticta capitalensis]|uniref:BTB domain-containing protein n=1 Tax=Phyllosticta capitalensis TaxID=121624 RepID=A0ABR1YIU7_9PEZI
MNQSELHKGLKVHVDDNFKSQWNTDLTIRCKDENLYVHKVILGACSPFFANMCGPNSSFKEALTGVVVLDNDDPFFVRLFLIYCYTGDLDANRANEWANKHHPLLDCEFGDAICFVYVYALADKYCCDGLKRRAEDGLHEVVSRDIGSKGEDGLLFSRIVRLVYETTPGSDRGLRDLVLHHMVRRVENLMQYKSCKAILNGIDGFWADYVQYLALTQERARKCPICRAEMVFSFENWAFRRMAPSAGGAECRSCGKWSTVLEWNKEIDADQVTDEEEEGKNVEALDVQRKEERERGKAAKIQRFRQSTLKRKASGAR